MRKTGIALFCVSLCISVSFILPHFGKTTEFVDDSHINSLLLRLSPFNYRGKQYEY